MVVLTKETMVRRIAVRASARRASWHVRRPAARG